MSALAKKRTCACTSLRLLWANSGHPQTERPHYGGLPKSISSDEEWSSPYFLPGLRQQRLIWFQVGPRSRKNLGDAFDAGSQRTLQELNALWELLRIALGRLPCFVENAYKYRHTGCLAA